MAGQAIQESNKKVSLAQNFEVFFLNVVDGDTSVHVTMHNVCHHQYKNTTIHVCKHLVALLVAVQWFCTETVLCFK